MDYAWGEGNQNVLSSVPWQFSLSRVSLSPFLMHNGHKVSYSQSPGWDSYVRHWDNSSLKYLMALVCSCYFAFCRGAQTSYWCEVLTSHGDSLHNCLSSLRCRGEGCTPDSRKRPPCFCDPFLTVTQSGKGGELTCRKAKNLWKAVVSSSQVHLLHQLIADNVNCCVMVRVCLFLAVLECLPFS